MAGLQNCYKVHAIPSHMSDEALEVLYNVKDKVIQLHIHKKKNLSRYPLPDPEYLRFHAWACEIAQRASIRTALSRPSAQRRYSSPDDSEVDDIMNNARSAR